MSPLLSLLIFLATSYYQNNFCNADPIYAAEIKFAEPKAYPFIVSISKRRNIGILRPYYSHTCGGSLITRKHVLTAAHCYGKGTLFVYYKVKVGTHDLEGGKVYDINYWLKYDDWARETNNIPEYINNDISVIELKKLVDSGIKLAKISNTPINLLYGQKARTAGWGLLSNNTILRYMLEAELNIINREKCIDNIDNLSKYKGKYTLEMNQFCTNGDPYVVLDCGNSGSPLFIGDNEIIGINNSICPAEEFNWETSKDQQNLHLEVRQYLNFLRSVTNNFTSEESNLLMSCWPL